MKPQEPAFPTLDTADPALRPGLTSEYAAILLSVPDSGDPKIDAMIRMARRQKIAEAALQGLCADPISEAIPQKRIARSAVDLADALIAELEKQG